jgi:hypothetical protein
MILYPYVCVCVFSLRRESLDRILGDKPLLFQGGSVTVGIREDNGKTHTEASKNHNNVIGEEHLAHIRTIVVFLDDNVTYMFFYVILELHE